MVKAAMMHWAIDMDHNIKISAWGKFWDKTMNFSACNLIKENIVKNGLKVVHETLQIGLNV